MAVKVDKKHLQENKYDYVWSRDSGDSEYAGKLDRIKVDKDEGYEVLYFIQSLMNKHGLTKVSDVHAIEDALHASELSSVVMRDLLNQKVEKKLCL